MAQMAWATKVKEEMIMTGVVGESTEGKRSLQREKYSGEEEK